MNFFVFKPKLVFLIGFGIGFSFALLLLLIENLFNNASLHKEKSRYSWHHHLHDHYSLPKVMTSNTEKLKWIVENRMKKPRDVMYKEWLTLLNLQTKNIDIDRYAYGPKNNWKESALEAEWLKSRVHITCVIFAEKVKLAKSIKMTWASRCNEVHFFGKQVKDLEIPILNVGVKLTSSWQLLCEAMNYIYHKNGTLNWIIFVRDDTIVIPENLRYFVAPLDHNKDYYLGHSIIMWGQAYNVAQSGYVLSKGAFDKIVAIFNTSEKCMAGGKYWKKEDYYLGKHLSSIGIHPLDTRDKYLRNTFHGYSLQNLLWEVAKPDSYWTRALYPSGDECCSPTSVTFSVSEADKMHTFNYLLYYLQVFKDNSIFGNRLAPTTVPDEEVWRTALKDEFNITYSDDISTDAYFKIWHSKYSEPEQFIEKNYQHMPSVLNSLLTAYENRSKSSSKAIVN